MTHTCTCVGHCVERLLREVAISQVEEWISKETLANKHKRVQNLLHVPILIIDNYYHGIVIHY